MEYGFLLGKRYVLMDRDTKFCEAFRGILNDEVIKPLRLPPQSPNLNANLERYFRSLKDEYLSRMIFFGEKSLRRAVDAYIEHYHGERNHQGLANELIQPGDEAGAVAGDIERREGLGGLLPYQYRDAEGTQLLGFTEVGRLAHNRHIVFAAAVRMVGNTRSFCPRRRVMSGQGSLFVPPAPCGKRSRSARPTLDATNVRTATADAADSGTRRRSPDRAASKKGGGR